MAPPGGRSPPGVLTDIPGEAPLEEALEPLRTHQKGDYVMAITVAEKVLIVGGVLNLAYRTLLGYPITVIRARGAPATPKYLMTGHISALLQAAVLLGLVRAARLSTLGPGWLDVAAWLVVVSSALIAAKDTLNLAHRRAGRVQRKGQGRAVGWARCGRGDNWHRHLRRRRPRSAVTPVVNSLGSLAHIGMPERRQPRPSRPNYADRAGWPACHCGRRRAVPRAAALHCMRRRHRFGKGREPGLPGPCAGREPRLSLGLSLAFRTSLPKVRSRMAARIEDRFMSAEYDGRGRVIATARCREHASDIMPN